MERDDQGTAAIGSPAARGGDGDQSAYTGQDQQHWQRDAGGKPGDANGSERAQRDGRKRDLSQPGDGERGGGADGCVDRSRHGEFHDQSPGERGDRPDIPLRHPRLVALPVDLLAAKWRDLAPWLEAVAENSNRRFTAEGIARKIASGDWQLWAVVTGKMDAIVATSIGEEPSGLKTLTIIFANGMRARNWAHLVSVLETWAKRVHSVDRVDILARKGWVKHLPHYRMTHVMLERDI